MKLSVLLAPWFNASYRDCAISAVHNDSRQITPGSLFIAYPGALVDGRAFIANAVAAGAVAVAFEAENWTKPLPATVPCIPVVHLAKQLAAIANLFYNNPSATMAVSGVTGTNGKTTIAYQLTQAHSLLGQRAAYIGTLGQGEIGRIAPLRNTTPDALCVQHLLADYQQQGMQQVCMEVSSQALAEHRVDMLSFREAIYTNLSHEHLDYHRTMAAYATAKALLFANPALAWVILNQDDSYVQYMRAVVPKNTQVLTYGITQMADVRAQDCRVLLDGSHFTVTSPWGEQAITIPSLGLFNIYNALAVYTSLLAHGYPADAVVATLASLKGCPGRMEVVAHKPYIIVDYAHTPAALDNVLTTLVQLQAGKNRKIWVVFGCGGDRDPSKRPLMGQIVSRHAAEVIVTSDNPRHENPAKIIEEILTGIGGSAAVTTIADRRAAIRYVLDRAEAQDIVLIAGKGHEAYQIIGDQRLAFSDQEEVRHYIDARG